MDLVRQIDRRIPCVRKASRQIDMPLPFIVPIKKYFCCPIFSRKKKQKQINSTSQSK
jgi:hypothetical protein